MTLEEIRDRVADANMMAKERSGRNYHVMPNGTVHFQYDPIPKRMAKRMLLRARKAIGKVY